MVIKGNLDTKNILSVIFIVISHPNEENKGSRTTSRAITAIINSPLAHSLFPRYSMEYESFYKVKHWAMLVLCW